MRSLSKKLKSLEASVSGQKAIAEKTEVVEKTLPELSALQERLGGQWMGLPEGNVFYVETRYPITTEYGRSKVNLSSSLSPLALWLKQEELQDAALEELLFLDTETTGLAGGAGTYAFLVGLGWFEDGEFCLQQLFLRDPSEEVIFLKAVEQCLQARKILVTFNGKSYDAPLLRTRFEMQKEEHSLLSMGHLDLLPLARRLWSNRLPSRRLRALETDILGVERSEEDIEGHLIPDVYFGFLKDGGVGQLPNVFHHNKMDIVAMVALLEHIAHLSQAPLDGRIPHAEDLAGLAQWLEQQGHKEEAIALYDAALQGKLPEELRQKVLQRFALLKKRDEDWNAAVALWILNATKGAIDAHVELAKYYEHKVKQLDEALHWTQKALTLIRSPKVPRFERFRWWDELEHRRDRLLRKQQGLPVEEEPPPTLPVPTSTEDRAALAEQQVKRRQKEGSRNPRRSRRKKK